MRERFLPRAARASFSWCGPERRVSPILQWDHSIRSVTPEEYIAHYRVTAKIGEGGMGAVYRATDTKLHRDVAIKVIPDYCAADPDRMARFAREAQVLASLNHPNIAAIHGVEERALVLELVEGPTLAERIAAGPIPLEDALPVARQLAEALEYAHEKSIVHRDLKPANIKVTPEGQVKVLDFGLAKALAGDALSADPMSSPTLTMRATMAGMIMGTAAYMSPEQAKGKPVDRRADIWAFGVVLLEMLTGRSIYTGETVSETLAAVILKEPDISGLPADTPQPIRRLIKRCLDKDPKRRLQAIGEARLMIEEAGTPEAVTTPVPSPVAGRNGVPVWAAALPVVVALVLAGGWWRAAQPVERPMVRFSADLGPDAVIGLRTTGVISPDGTRIAFPVRASGGSQFLATQLLSQSKATVLNGTENAFDAFFSPDSQWIGFFSGGKLKKISVQGGAAVTLCDAAPNARGAAWGEDGQIIGTLDGQQLSIVPEAGGTPQILAKPEDEGLRTYRYPQILPGGQNLIVTAAGKASVGYEDAEIRVFSLKTRKTKVVQRGGYFGRYLPSGHLVYLHQGTLFGVKFDASRLETRGQPAPVIEEVAGIPGQGAAPLGFSRNGTLVYYSGKALDYNTPLVWMDSAGKQEPLGPSAAGTTIRLSPDGRLLALAKESDIFVYDPQRSALLRLTFSSGGVQRFPVWLPDGKHIIYSSANETLWCIRSDGSGQPFELLKEGGVPVSISPDGKYLASHKAGSGTNRDIWILPLDNTDPDHPKAGTPEVFVRTPTADVEPMFSPDGHWIAYTSADSGSNQVFVRPFPEGLKGGGKWQISTAPGRFPIWARNGRELFFESMEGHIMVADYTVRGDAFIPGKPRQWSPTPIQLTAVFQNLDLHPDGKRFVVIPRTATEQGTGQTVHVVFLLNFFDELKRKLP